MLLRSGQLSITQYRQRNARHIVATLCGAYKLPASIGLEFSRRKDLLFIEYPGRNGVFGFLLSLKAQRPDRLHDRQKVGGSNPPWLNLGAHMDALAAQSARAPLSHSRGCWFESQLGELWRWKGRCVKRAVSSEGRASVDNGEAAGSNPARRIESEEALVAQLDGVPVYETGG